MTSLTQQVESKDDDKAVVDDGELRAKLENQRLDEYRHQEPVAPAAAAAAAAPAPHHEQVTIVDAGDFVPQQSEHRYEGCEGGGVQCSGERFTQIDGRWLCRHCVETGS